MTDQPIPASATRIAQDAAEFAWDGHGPEPGIGVALSGGGFRAMLFHAGALARLNELGILTKTKRIASVSGGSIAAGYLASVWGQLGSPDAAGAFSDFKARYVDPMLEFSREKIDVVDALIGLLPWTSAAEQVAKSYDRHLFDGRTLQDLPDQPRFVFCATNLQTGVLFRFSKAYAGDYLVGRYGNPTIRLSLAVAASSAFPPVLSPLLLQLPAGSFKDWPDGSNAQDLGLDLDAFRQRIVLTDGGVYDNHGIEPIVKRYTTAFVSDGGAPFGRMADIEVDWISQLRRLVDVTDNQVRALRRRDLVNRLIEGNEIADEKKLVAQPYPKMGAYWGIDTDPTPLNPPDALPCSREVTRELARVATRLSDLGERTSKQLINWGYVVCDRSLRTHYKGSVGDKKPALPFSDAPLG